MSDKSKTLRPFITNIHYHYDLFLKKYQYSNIFVIFYVVILSKFIIYKIFGQKLNLISHKNVKSILHSDQGWQYQMKEYQNLLKEHNVIQSMSRKEIA